MLKKTGNMETWKQTYCNRQFTYVSVFPVFILKLETKNKNWKQKIKFVSKNKVCFLY
jgi:hypothetical protein